MNNDATTFIITITARARAFTGEGVRSHRMTVDGEGTVCVWDPVAGHYTTCHAMSERTCRRIRQEAIERLLDAARCADNHQDQRIFGHGIGLLGWYLTATAEDIAEGIIESDDEED